MTRIATAAHQQIITGALLDIQEKLRGAQQQLASGRKAETFSGLGVDASRSIPARNLSLQWQAHQSAAKVTATTLKLYDAQLGEVDNLATDLQTAVTLALGSGQADGLQQLAEEAWGRFRGALNSTEGAVALFAGSRTDTLPVKALNLSDTAGKTLSDLFANDDVKMTTRVAPGTDVKYGITASEVGTDIMEAFRDLADMGPIGRQPTTAQLTALSSVAKKLESGISTVRNINSGNGLRQNLLQQNEDMAQARQALFDEAASNVEDADLGQVAINISNYRAALEASFSLMGRLQNLSLANFLR